MKPRILLLPCLLFALSGCVDLGNVDETPAPPDPAPVTPKVPADDMTRDVEPNVPDMEMDATSEEDIVVVDDADMGTTDDEDMPIAQEDMEDMPPVDPCTIDTDGDTLSDCVEAQLGTDSTLADTDFDGLSDADELQLGTDPLVVDTDRDGLGDFEEFQQNTDPTDPDTDGDGVRDADELQLGFDPNKPDSFGDGVLDGERFIATACDTPASEPVDYYKNDNGDWLLALPAAFNNYTELTPATAPPRVMSAVFDDPVNEVAAFILSNDISGQPNPITVRNSYDSAIAATGTVQQTFSEGAFRTHDSFQAASGTYEISTSGKSARQVRDELLFGFAPFEATDVTGTPNASGNIYSDYIIKMTVIVRHDRTITLVTVAPQQLHDTRNAIQFRMSDLTNTTGVASSSAGHSLRCHAFPATTEIPKADFYWVLDQSGSMIPQFTKLKNFAQDFYNSLSNTALDFRLGVTNMEESFGGKLRANPGWHTDPHTFSNEIQYYVIDCSSNFTGCSDSQENGLYAARQGITYMKRSTTPLSSRIRAGAKVATIFMSDEEDQSIKDGQDPGGPNVGAARLLNDYMSFFAATPLAFSIVGTGNGCGSDGSAYRDVALNSGGAGASLCSQDLQSTIDTIIVKVAGDASPFRLPQTPISSTLRVFQASDDGKTGVWIPRSHDDGFDYFPQSNSIAFFGSYRPLPGATQPIQASVHYQVFKHHPKVRP